jgi:hypothetical protein
MSWKKVLLALLPAAGAVALSGSTASAGGWATTLLDPLPAQVTANQPFTVGFWILQHGSHPSVIALSSPGLTFIDEKGVALDVKGVALPEPAHYAGALALPHDGPWVVKGRQAPFADYEIGTLTVPGRLALLPAPETIPWDGKFWGTVHPPQVVAGPAPIASTQPAAAKTSPPARGPVLPDAVLGLLAGLALATVGWWLAGRVRAPRTAVSSPA